MTTEGENGQPINTGISCLIEASDKKIQKSVYCPAVHPLADPLPPFKGLTELEYLGNEVILLLLEVTLHLFKMSDILADYKKRQIVQDFVGNLFPRRPRRHFCFLTIQV